MTWMYLSTTGEPMEAAEAELSGLAQHGLLTPSTLVWHSGRPDWVPAAEVKPELFASGFDRTANLNLARAVMEPLWLKRGWVWVIASGLMGAALLRAGVAALEAWPNGVKLAWVAVSVLVSTAVIAVLIRWAQHLGRAAATSGLQEARDAARAGGRVLVVCGLVGILLMLLAVYDVISLAAHWVLDR
ncbi:MAG: DUF4339 domain-containing protein [Verrucomicrobiales bacterium]